MHRDIGWKNLSKIGREDKWQIVNFNHACHCPSDSPYNGLAYTAHAPEIFNRDGTHDKSVDIWSVGYLIKTSSQDKRLLEYSEKLMADNPKERPTAKEAYTWLWDEYENLLHQDFSRENSMDDE